jgi:hypothetical protein
MKRNGKVEPVFYFRSCGRMPDGRNCWIDDGISPVYEAWLRDLTGVTATIDLPEGHTLPATFAVFFAWAGSIRERPPPPATLDLPRIHV